MTEEAEKKDNEIKFSKKELTKLLGVDVIPGILLAFHNSVISYRRDNPISGPLPLSPDGGYMVRAVQQGKEEKIYHGEHESSTNLPQDRENSVGCYEMSSGFSHKTVHLTLGMNNPKSTWNVSKEEQASPTFNDKSDAFVKKAEAIGLYVYYGNQKAMPVTLCGDHLGVGDPESKEQMVEALKAISEVMKDIREDQKPDYTALRKKLIEEVGLEAKRPYYGTEILGLELN